MKSEGGPKNMFNDLLAFLSNGIPSRVEAIVIATSSVICGWLSLVLGGIDLPLQWLFAFVVVDFVLGNWVAFKDKAWCSKVECAGIFKKISIFFFVALCQGIDVICGTDFMRSGAIAAYALMEIGSIVAKVDALGYGHLIPTFVRQGIKAIEEKQDKKMRGAKKNEF